MIDTSRSNMTSTRLFVGINVGVWLLASAIIAGLRQLCAGAWIGSGNNIGAITYAPRGCSTTFYPIESVGFSRLPAPDISTVEPLQASFSYHGLLVGDIPSDGVELLPGETFDLLAAPTLGMAPPFKIELTWHDDRGVQSGEQTLSL